SSATNGWGPAERDQSNGETPSGDGVVLTTGAVSYVRGFGVHATSDLTLSTTGCSRFTAYAGIDGEVTNSAASVVFSVVADGTTIYTSPTVTVASGPVTVDLNISGRSTVHLLVGDAGNGNSYDHADWADARLSC